jgi:hypothetical protein
MIINYKYILFAFICSCFFACNNNTTNNGAVNNIIKEWTDKTIIFPNVQSTAIKLKARDTFKYVVTGDKKYKILLYVDSTGCTSCKLQLHVWKSYMEKLSSEADFLFYFHPKTEKEILSLLEYELFSYPIYIDKKDELNKLNKFPANPSFQCFLLDKDNRILAIGNPANNPKIWDLYKKIITGEISDKPPVTTVEAEQTEIELKNLQTGKASETVFILKNTGKQPLAIQMVDASCGCTVPNWVKQPVAAGKTTEIKVRITPEEQGYFNKTVTVHCNTESGQVSLKIKGMAED